MNKRLFTITFAVVVTWLSKLGVLRAGGRASEPFVVHLFVYEQVFITLSRL